MVERRQATRREPIEVEVRDKVFEAHPLPWQQANDLGNEIVRQNAEAANAAVRMYVQDDIPQLELALQTKISDWNIVLLVAYPNHESVDFMGFDIDECAALILASLEVNHLEHLNNLVDPNSHAPMIPGGSEPSGLTTTEPGEKTE